MFSFFRYLMMAVLLSATLYTQGQVVTTNPEFPVDNQAVEIIFDATQGNQGLMGYTGDVYAHTGVITNLSSSPSDWKYTKTAWGTNTPETKLERLSANLYKLSITPDIRAYYGVPASQIILRMAFVFRSGVEVGGSYKEGKDVGNADIFADVYPPGLSINITSPAGNNLIYVENDTIYIQALSPQADSIWFYNNANLSKAVAGYSLTDTVTALPVNGYWSNHFLVFKAKNENETVTDTIRYQVIPLPTVADLPEGMKDGANYTGNSSVLLNLQAPGKKNVFVIGSFNDWGVSAEYYMNKTADGERFWLEIDNLVPQQEYIYQFLVDGTIRIADPYTDKTSDPWNDKYITATTYPGLIPYPTGKTTGVASVLQTAQEPYVWEVENFTPPPKDNLVIYELLIRDFTAKHTYQSLIDTLGYLERLGVNAIELMPVNEFEGNSSWGYNPSFYFAPDKYYGPKNDLKKFIDECHKNGIAVILDMVLNHAYGLCPLVRLYWDEATQSLADDNPWFNKVSPNTAYSWGYDFNHESDYTKQFVDRVNRYWLTEYKFDGFRFDFTKGFTNKPGDGWAYDASRINILKRMADSIWAVNPEAYIILEHFADNSEEKILANYGMMLWGNLNGAYTDAAMGYLSNSDLSWIDYKRRGWNNPHVVGYMESHDEERMMYKNLTWGVMTNPDYPVKDMTIGLERSALATAFFLPLPGPKMIWQFGELGYDFSIDYNGRVGEKPIKWDYYNDWRRRYLYEVYASLNHLKTTYPVFRTTNYTHKLSGADRRIVLKHESMDVVVAGNFDVTEKTLTPGFTKTGTWYEFFTGDTLEVTSITAGMAFQPGEYRLWSTLQLPKPANLNTGIADGNPVTGFTALVYPNPAGEWVNTAITVNRPGRVRIYVSDIAGRPLKNIAEKHLDSGKHLETFSTAALGLRPGIYLLTINLDNESLTHKLIIH